MPNQLKKIAYLLYDALLHGSITVCIVMLANERGHVQEHKEQAGAQLHKVQVI